jgi:hypothetical protein
MNGNSRDTGVLQARVDGLHRALLRYRRGVLLGWVLVAGGVAGIFVRWDTRAAIGLMDILLSAMVVAAGLILVSHALEFLSAYAHTLFRDERENGTGTDLERELDELAREVVEGGWQEAFVAGARVRAIAERHGLKISE